MASYKPTTVVCDVCPLHPIILSEESSCTVTVDAISFRVGRTLTELTWIYQAKHLIIIAWAKIY